MTIDKETAWDVLERMVEIPSFSGGERSLALFLVEQMNALGYKAGLDGAGNAVGHLGAAGPEIMLLGHMDTVDGRVRTRRKGTQLWGRGTVDAKGPLATFVLAAAEAHRAGLPARLVVVGAVEEETPGSRGAKHLLDRYSPAAVVIGEPSGWSNVVLGYKGRIGIGYSISRPRRHDAAMGENAAHLAIGFWNRLESWFEDGPAGEKSLFYRATAALRCFEGTPEKAKLDISCRIPPGFDTSTFSRFVDGVRGDGEVVYSEVTPAVLVDRSDPVVRSLVTAIRAHGGRPGLRVKSGTSDFNTVATRWTVPMAAYGPGDSRLDHTSDEHIDLDEYYGAIGTLADALQGLARELEELAPAVELAAAAKDMPADAATAFTPEEEEELQKRLQALGYLE